MGKISQKERMKNYYRIFEQIYGDPVMSLYDIAANTELSRNTVSKYLREMYAKSIIRGPSLRMKPTQTYREYVYLLNFSDPWKAFRGLKGFPHVVYHGLTCGDWNTMVITDRLLDLSKLVGSEAVIHQGVRYYSYTPKVGYTLWDESFANVYEQLDRFTPVETEYKDRRLTSLDWSEDEWKMFHAFNFMRKKVTPVLQKIKVRYEAYIKWMKTLHNHCTLHTGFYPQGYKIYLDYCFLLFTDYEKSVKSLFSLFPTTPFIMEVDTQLLVFINVSSSDVQRKLFCLLYDMKRKQMIKRFRHAVALFNSQNRDD
ncbi:MAG: hypothetical protein HXS48_19620 [Theionarchaea archaeon]|nr:hypothetical protein [Theionarchaea archaeon]